MYLFNDGKVYRWTLRDDSTLEKFLDFLSGDNYVEASVLVSDDSVEFINKALGRTGLNSKWVQKYSQ